MTCGSVKTGGSGAVVNVLRTVVSRPTVDADTIVTTDGIGTGCTVLTDLGTEGAFVNVLKEREASIGICRKMAYASTL
jgi:hypothetical protein